MSVWKKLFGEHGAKDVITLFHKPSAPGSTRVLTFLKQQRATASATATEDQASSHDHHNAEQRAEFELDVTESPPTADQLKNILEYVGSQNAGKIIEGAMNEGDALKKLSQNPGAFIRPLVVDWHQGKVVIGDNQSELQKLLKEVSKQ